MLLNITGQLSEEGGGGAATAGTSGNGRPEGAEIQGLEDLLAEAHFSRPVAAGLGGEAGADGITDALVEEDGEGGGCGNDTLGAHSCLGEAEVKREVALTGDFSIGLDHLVEAGDFAGDDDVVFREAKIYGGLGAGYGAFDQGLALYCITRDGVEPAGVIIHLLCKKVGVQAAGVDTDADGLIEVSGDFDEGPEVIIVAKAAPHVAGVDPELGKGAGAVRLVAEEPVADEVEVADYGNVAADIVQALADSGHGGGGSIIVYGDAY